MGLFGGIIDSVKNIGSYIADTSVNLFGSVTDILKPEKEYIPTDRPQKDISPQFFDYDFLYDDYADWIDEIWY